MDKVQVKLHGSVYAVIGGEFWEMLEQVKNIPGRFYSNKVWNLPLSLEESREVLLPLRIVNEDELFEAEIADIQRVQTRILALASEIQEQSSVLYSEVKQYSYRSKSAIKAGKVCQMGRLDHALEYAAMPVEQLTEPQIKTLYAALRDMGEE